MKTRLRITDLNGMKNFVRAAESNDSSVLVSKEGYKNFFDGSSLMAMLWLVSDNIIVSCESCSKELQQVLDAYAI